MYKRILLKSLVRRFFFERESFRYTLSLQFLKKGTEEHHITMKTKK